MRTFKGIFCCLLCLIALLHVFVQCIIVGASPRVYLHMLAELVPFMADRFDESTACASLTTWQPHGEPVRHTDWRPVELQYCGIADFLRMFQANDMRVGIVTGLYARGVSTVIIYEEPLCGDLINRSPHAIVVDISDTAPVVTAPGQTVAVKTLTLDCVNSSKVHAIPLPQKTRVRYLEPDEPRRYLATFAGTIYLTKIAASERQAVISLHNPDAGIVAVGACHMGQDAYRMLHNLAYCSKLQRVSSRYTQQELRNTTFGLVPVGRSPATFRLAETILGGQIPIIIAPRSFRLPFADSIPWELISLRFEPGKEFTIPKTIREMSPDTIQDMLNTAKPHLYKFHLRHIIEVALEVSNIEFRNE